MLGRALPTLAAASGRCTRRSTGRAQTTCTSVWKGGRQQTSGVLDLLFAEVPWSAGIDERVRLPHQGGDRLKCLLVVETAHRVLERRAPLADSVEESAVVIQHVTGGHDTLGVAVDHGGEPAHEVADPVGEVVVVAGHEPLDAEVPVAVGGVNSASR